MVEPDSDLRFSTLYVLLASMHKIKYSLSSPFSQIFFKTGISFSFADTGYLPFAEI